MVNHRLLYLALALCTMLLGLASRSDQIVLPEFLATYAGDTLWALLVFWLIRAVAPSSTALSSALIAISFSFLIECSQLYHTPWIDSIRSTTLGGLVLGYGFKVSDLACYCVGVCFGYALTTLVSHRNR